MARRTQIMCVDNTYNYVKEIKWIKRPHKLESNQRV